MSLLRFGAFELDLRTGELRKLGSLISLPPQPFRILVLLASHPGQLVTREEIQQQIWGSETFVDFERGLNFAINKIRTVLGDDAEAPRYIETLPRRGYRFVASVEGVRPALEAPSPSPIPVAAEGGAKSGPVEPKAVGTDPVPAPSVNPAPQAPALATPSVHGDALETPMGTQNPPLPKRWSPRLAAMAAMLAVGVAAGWLAWHRVWPLSSQVRPGSIQSLAVLPLENLSGDKDQEYFADGMTDALITDLGKVSALRVISRTSTLQYKGTKKTLPQIAQELKVDAVVEGTVTHSGGRVRITAQLIDAKTDRHLWADTYERELKDVLALQSGVARAIAGEIRIKVTPAEQRLLEAAPAVNPEAHDAWARGNYHLNKGTEEDLKKAIDYFHQALAKEPGFAQAYVGLGETYISLCPAYRSPRQVIPQAREAAIKALELDDSLAEAHAVLGGVRVMYDWDWSSAEKEFRRAIELDANSASAHEGYANYYSAVGKSRDAVGEMKRAQELDPLSLGAIIDRAWTLYMAQAYDEAMSQCKQDLDISPTYGFAHCVLGLIALDRGQRELALAETRKGVEVDASPFNLEMLGTVEAVLGMRAEALGVVESLKKRSAKEYICLYELGAIYACLGQKDPAFQLLNRAYDDRDICMMWLQVDPRFKSLHSNPRFHDLLRRMGLPVR